MSWLFSRVQVEDCLRLLSLVGKPCALSSLIGTADAFSCSDKMTDSLDPFSRYGMTFVPLTVERGAGPLMLCLEASLAKRLAPLRQGTTQPMIFGRKCAESWQMSLPGTSSPRTSVAKQSMQRQTTSRRWVTKPERLNFRRQTWVATTFGVDVGFLHTPTTRGNYCAPSMQKWPSCRAYRLVFGKVTPESHEYLMGWPIGWSELRPLEMGRFQSWLSAHLSPSATQAEKEAA